MAWNIDWARVPCPVCESGRLGETQSPMWHGVRLHCSDCGFRHAFSELEILTFGNRTQIAESLRRAGQERKERLKYRPWRRCDTRGQVTRVHTWQRGL